jgi:hypothetical protein
MTSLKLSLFAYDGAPSKFFSLFFLGVDDPCGNNLVRKVTQIIFVLTWQTFYSLKSCGKLVVTFVSLASSQKTRKPFVPIR